MKRSELPKCPTCGSTVEYFAKEGRWAGTAEIRCVGHHRIGSHFAAGDKRGVRERLIREWHEMTENVNREKNA
ncbi:TPA: hypothetical protein N3A50_000323 [Salmonella enterica subsp. salamae serovar 30:g,m,s:e,n,x]|nr:hypothetical protein [Salmonella enterica subsp. salamae serovar 30:g,m,s:e,n,x]